MRLFGVVFGLVACAVAMPTRIDKPSTHVHAATDMVDQYRKTNVNAFVDIQLLAQPPRTPRSPDTVTTADKHRRLMPRSYDSHSDSDHDNNDRGGSRHTPRPHDDSDSESKHDNDRTGFDESGRKQVPVSDPERRRKKSDESLSSIDLETPKTSDSKGSQALHNDVSDAESDSKRSVDSYRASDNDVSDAESDSKRPMNPRKASDNDVSNAESESKRPGMTPQHDTSTSNTNIRNRRQKSHPTPKKMKPKQTPKNKNKSNQNKPKPNPTFKNNNKQPVEEPQYFSDNQHIIHPTNPSPFIYQPSSLHNTDIMTNKDKYTNQHVQVVRNENICIHENHEYFIPSAKACKKVSMTPSSESDESTTTTPKTKSVEPTTISSKSNNPFTIMKRNPIKTTIGLAFIATILYSLHQYIQNRIIYNTTTTPISVNSNPITISAP